MRKASVSFAALGDNTVVAAVAGKKIHVYALILNTASDVTATIKSGASTSLTGVMSFAGKGGIILDPLHEDHDAWFDTAVGEAFVINLGSAVQTSGRIFYTVL